LPCIAPPGQGIGWKGCRLEANVWRPRSRHDCRAVANVVSVVDRGVFRRHRNAPNGGARPRLPFATTEFCM
jgi:hypothetical protein